MHAWLVQLIYFRTISFFCSLLVQKGQRSLGSSNTFSTHQAKDKDLISVFLFHVSHRFASIHPSWQKCIHIKKNLTKHVQLAGFTHTWRKTKCKEKQTVHNNYKFFSTGRFRGGRGRSERSRLLVGTHRMDVFKGQILQGQRWLPRLPEFPHFTNKTQQKNNSWCLRNWFPVNASVNNRLHFHAEHIREVVDYTILHKGLSHCVQCKKIFIYQKLSLLFSVFIVLYLWN